MQDHPGAPGSARQRNPGTDGTAACGGAAVPSPQAWDHVRSRAVPLHTPLAPDHVRSGAVPLPLAPNHHRSGAASMASPGHAGCGPAFAGPSVPLTTAPWPAHASRLLQVVLPRVPATPLALIYRQSHSTTHHVHPAILAPTHPPPATAGTGFLRQRHSRAPPPPARRQPILVGYGLPAPQGMWIPAHAGTTAAAHPLSTWWRGGRGVRQPPLTCRPCRR